ncbi:MAG: hypothetical protein AABZ67_10785 [Pseudomonadota bacterium]
MKFLVGMIAAAMLAGCGAEVATTAATGAAIKKQELEEGMKTQERAQQKINEAMEQTQQRAQQSDQGAR